MTQRVSLKDALAVEEGWIRWLPNKRPAAAYMRLKNHGTQPAELVSASSPDYGFVNLHQSIVQDGKSKMVAIDHLAVPANGEVRLMPGGYHLMLEQAKRTIVPGDLVKVALKFSDGTILKTGFPVRSPASN